MFIVHASPQPLFLSLSRSLSHPLSRVILSPILRLLGPALLAPVARQRHTDAFRQAFRGATSFGLTGLRILPFHPSRSAPLKQATPLLLLTGLNRALRQGFGPAPFQYVTLSGMIFNIDLIDMQIKCTSRKYGLSPFNIRY